MLYWIKTLLGYSFIGTELNIWSIASENLIYTKNILFECYAQMARYGLIAYSAFCRECQVKEASLMKYADTLFVILVLKFPIWILFNRAATIDKYFLNDWKILLEIQFARIGACYRVPWVCRCERARHWTCDLRKNYYWKNYLIVSKFYQNQNLSKSKPKKGKSPSPFHCYKKVQIANLKNLIHQF